MLNESGKYDLRSVREGHGLYAVVRLFVDIEKR